MLHVHLYLNGFCLMLLFSALYSSIFFLPHIRCEPDLTFVVCLFFDGAERQRNKQTGKPHATPCCLGEMAVPDRVVATRLGSLHHRHPLIVVAEEGEVQVRAAAVGLGTDGQLAQQPPHSLRVSAVLGVDDSVFESGGGTQSGSVPFQHPPQSRPSPGVCAIHIAV